MTDQEILERCSRVLRDILMDDSLMLAMETKRQDVPAWDSFAYITFIAVLEMELGVKFRVAEIESFEDVGAIVRRIRELLPS
jgi:acyl carrier protein